MKRFLRHRRPPGTRRGLTLVELVIALSVAAVSASIFYRLVLATTDLRSLNRENAIAAGAAGMVLEDLRSVAFRDLWATYNAEPADDPGGAGTAAGATFLVPELPLVPGEAAHGTIVFPAEVVQVEETVEGEIVLVDVLQLREDLDWPELGLPRDLNGDSLIDDVDHSLDYQLLPVRVEVRWQGAYGPRTFELTTMLCELR